MKTINILILMIALGSNVNVTTAQYKSVDKSAVIENNFIYEITCGFETSRSANIMSALQYYVTNPDLNRLPIIEILVKVIRCDANAENRFAALMAVTVLNDETLIATINNQKSTDLEHFTQRIQTEIGLHFFATANKHQ